MGPGVRSTATEPIAARASACAPNGMPTSWATPSETDAAATPAIIRSLDGATTIELLYSRSPQQLQIACRAAEPAALWSRGPGDRGRRCRRAIEVVKPAEIGLDGVSESPMKAHGPRRSVQRPISKWTGIEHTRRTLCRNQG